MEQIMGGSLDVKKMDVLKQVIELSFHWESEGVINIGWIAKSMDSSPYPISQMIKSLVDEDYLEQSIRSGGWCEYSCEPYPPLKGYSLTKKAKQTVLYVQAEKDFEAGLRQAFDC